jgi:hypothetical protein
MPFGFANITRICLTPVTKQRLDFTIHRTTSFQLGSLAYFAFPGALAFKSLFIRFSIFAQFMQLIRHTGKVLPAEYGGFLAREITDIVEM